MSASGATLPLRDAQGNGRHLAATARSSVPGAPAYQYPEGWHGGDDDECQDQYWPDDSPQYLSREWENEQHEWLEERYGDGLGCGGITGPEPCGGCIDCMHAQMSYYISTERKQTDTYHAAGFEFLQPGIVSITWESGMSAGHDSYNCKMANEREEYSFPWEKKIT